MIDTHKQVKILEGGGFTDKQAESLVTVLTNFLSSFCTKKDLQDAESKLERQINETNSKLERQINDTNSKLERKINETDSRLDAKIHNLEEHLESKIKETELRLTIRLGSIMFALLLSFKILDKFI